MEYDKPDRFKTIDGVRGPALQTVSFEMVLDAGLGVRPKRLLESLEEMTESGTAEDLVLGRRRIGKNPWVITKCSQAYDLCVTQGRDLPGDCITYFTGICVRCLWKDFVYRFREWRINRN